MTQAHSKNSRSLIKNAGIIGLATLLSRILGFVRDMVTASYLGTSIYADAFFVAFRIPNLLRRLFGEGSLTAAFVPVFSSYLAADKRTEAKEIAQLVRQTLSTDVKIETIPSDDHRSYHISSDKIRRELNFNPKYKVVDAIKEIQTAFTQRVVQDPDDTKYYNVKFMKENKIT